MNRENVIAIIKLAKGRVGYYDPLSRIHLTLGNPVKAVTKFMNTTNLITAARDKSIELVEGTLIVPSTINNTKSEPEANKIKIEKNIEHIEDLTAVNEDSSIEDIDKNEQVQDKIKIEETKEILKEKKILLKKNKKRRKKSKNFLPSFLE